MNLPPLSLYVHIPWCVRKCPYCDFNSHEVKERIDTNGYVDALLADLDGELAGCRERALQSIFIGGGTPSLFPPADIGRLLQEVRQRIAWSEQIEITLEANPGAVEAEQFAALRETGVNRLSIGIQSFHADSLKALGRIHGPDEASRAVERARTAGFERINLDLMFGLPGQREAQAVEDVRIAAAFGTEHLSYYQLTLEPNTLFHRRPPELPDEERLWSIQEAGQRELQAAGFEQYEVSAYARAGGQCRHNLNYWRFGDYLGIGAGAHGKLTRDDGVIERRWKRRHPADYLAGTARGEPLQGRRRLTTEDRIIEFMMNALRLRQGVESELFTAVTGVAPERIAGAVALARQRGLLESDASRLCATELGFRFLTDLLVFFESEKQL